MSLFVDIKLLSGIRHVIAYIAEMQSFITRKLLPDAIYLEEVA